ncbi:MAG TPA: dienelactone hydrolase [Microlunatus sp.]|nr:dienelactone hydrolase [Microlunatus sp.]
MAEVLLIHHILGRTPGVVALADRFRAAGHTVHLPDLYEGRTFATIEEGAAFVQGADAPDFSARADQIADDLGPGVVWAGISFGVIQAQRLAQTRAGAAGAILMEACVPVTGDWAFGPWPEGVPVQIHGMEADPFFAGEGDLDAARELVSLNPAAELYLYPGDRHLFADSSLVGHDSAATDLLVERALGFLSGLG